MSRKSSFLLPGLSLFAACVAPPAREVPMLVARVESTGVFESGEGQDLFGLAYRFGELDTWRIIPSIGAAVGDGGDFLAFADLRRSFWIDERWGVAPSLGVGASDEGDSLDFRLGAELFHRFPSDAQLGLALIHHSESGGSGQGDEAVAISFAFPLTRAARASPSP